MAAIPLAPAPGPTSPGPAQYFTIIRAAVAAIVDHFELCARDTLNLTADFEQVAQRLDLMHHGFDGVMPRLNGLGEALDDVGETLKRLGEKFNCIGEESDVMEETLDDVVKKVSAMEEKIKVMEEKITELISGNGVVWPIRLYNNLCSLDALLFWPPVLDPPYPAGKPRTLAELQSMDSEMCMALVAALHLPSPPVPTPPPLDWRRKQVIKYLGCADFDAMSHSLTLCY
ncbi:hypothetical protein EDB19DRAFT_931517 [Suillus lakei]|nr:hypothetical protein EDB19DRAFT_931517 [Suillus lakei]